MNTELVSRFGKIALGLAIGILGAYTVDHMLPGGEGGSTACFYVMGAIGGLSLSSKL